MKFHLNFVCLWGVDRNLGKKFSPTEISVIIHIFLLNMHFLYIYIYIYNLLNQNIKIFNILIVLFRRVFFNILMIFLFSLIFGLSIFFVNI